LLAGVIAAAKGRIVTVICGDDGEVAVLQHHPLKYGIVRLGR
jgi:hypothetical protein